MASEALISLETDAINGVPTVSFRHISLTTE